MIYQRGHRRDFDGWAANGNFGWSYDEILPYFKRSERIGIPELYDSPFHGRTGNLDVQRAGFQSKLLSSFLNAGKEFGYPMNDPNGESQLGFSQTQATTRNGRRWSAAKAFLRPVQHRPNLFISMNSRVTKILIDPETKIAYGVEFLKGRRKFRIQAKKEVILSAGSIISVNHSYTIASIFCRISLNLMEWRLFLCDIAASTADVIRYWAKWTFERIWHSRYSGLTRRIQFTRSQCGQWTGLCCRLPDFNKRTKFTEAVVYAGLFSSRQRTIHNT